jgi:hypothetical protein
VGRLLLHQSRCHRERNLGSDRFAWIELFGPAFRLACLVIQFGIGPIGLARCKGGQSLDGARPDPQPSPPRPIANSLGSILASL